MVSVCVFYQVKPVLSSASLLLYLLEMKRFGKHPGHFTPIQAHRKRSQTLLSKSYYPEPHMLKVPHIFTDEQPQLSPAVQTSLLRSEKHERKSDQTV